MWRSVIKSFGYKSYKNEPKAIVYQCMYFNRKNQKNGICKTINPGWRTPISHILTQHKSPINIIIYKIMSAWISDLTI